MCFFFSLVPATVWAVIGYFVMFAATRAEGGLRKFGQVLAIWALVLAALIPLGGAFVTLLGLCPIDAMMQGMNPELASSALPSGLLCGCGMG